MTAPTPDPTQVLTEAEREVIGDMAGCGCCSSRYNLDTVFPDDCPRDGDYVDHSWHEGCNQDVSLDDLVESILRAHAERAWDEGFMDAAGQDHPAYPRTRRIDNPYRAARQEPTHD